VPFSLIHSPLFQFKVVVVGKKSKEGVYTLDFYPQPENGLLIEQNTPLFPLPSTADVVMGGG